MARKPAILITGANGEIGHGLITRLAQRGEERIIALDLHPFGPEIEKYCAVTLQGNILDQALLDQIGEQYDIGTIYHLAALLSTAAEKDPWKAQTVNVDGTLNLVRLGLSSGNEEPTRFFFPSSIAAYGFLDLAAKDAAGAQVGETQHLEPLTIYGCNKLACEQLGHYFTHRGEGVDFRTIRFPGLISATTLPTGGTSDYAPEMLHTAAQGKKYACFVREDTRIPFMAMPDAVAAILRLTAAPAESLSTRVYNITAFSPTAAEFAEQTRHAFPAAEITFKPDARRQAIVDSWPHDIDDTKARKDWGFAPQYDLSQALTEYLLPEIRQRYA